MMGTIWPATRPDPEQMLDLTADRVQVASMASSSFLSDGVVYMAASVVAVPLFRALGLGAVLGYLAAGIAIGPYGLEFVKDASAILHFAELGVVLLLFLIGLELEPTRLWNLRRPVFGLGGFQVGLTALVIGGIAMALQVPTGPAVVVGLTLALSSTAFALQLLAEKNQLKTVHGQSSFAILLFQDLAVIPILAIIPLFGAASADSEGGTWLAALETAAVIGGIVVGGRYFLRPIFRAIAWSRVREVFTAATLLLVIGIALVMQEINLSMALGSFLAGVLLAESEYRHQLEADIEPFKGLLLGLFFLAVGMSANLTLMFSQPLLVLALTAGLMAVKWGILYGLARISRIPSEAARNLAFTLPQGGEFGFVIFGMAATLGVMEQGLTDLLIVVVTLSMALTPLLIAMNERLFRTYHEISERPFDSIDEDTPVIIAGFGRVGQIVSRLLRLRGIPFTALEHSIAQVDTVRRFGNKIYYGDASRLDLLHAAGADKAKLFVLAIDDMETSIRVAGIVREHFPELRILARARNRQHAFELLELGIEDIWRETLPASMDMGRVALSALGSTSDEAARFVADFHRHDEQLLREQYKVRHDEKELIRYAKQAVEQLEEALRADDVERRQLD